MTPLANRAWLLILTYQGCSHCLSTCAGPVQPFRRDSPFLQTEFSALILAHYAWAPAMHLCLGYTFYPEYPFPAF